MEKDLIVSPEQEIILPPEQVIEQGHQMAKALAAVISLKKKPVIVNGEQYLEFEDWQTVARFLHLAVRTRDAIPVEINGVKGAKAQADVIDFSTGIIVGGAEAYCMSDEQNWEKKPWFQLASMAQTRAGAKALRNQLAWVVVLAGYRTTPAEEIQDTALEQQPDQTEHYCKVHNTPFFMRGKMKSFAHPIGDTGEWCHEHIEKQPPVTTSDQPPGAPEPIEKATNKETSAMAPAKTKKTAKIARDPATIKTFGDLYKACGEDFNLKTRKEVWAELNVTSQEQIADVAEAYEKIASVRGQ